MVDAGFRECNKAMPKAYLQQIKLNKSLPAHPPVSGRVAACCGVGSEAQRKYPRSYGYIPRVSVASATRATPTR